MALPRRLVRALRAGTYKPSNASKKAREVASQSRPQESPPQRVTFASVKARMKTKKHIIYRDDFKYNARESARNVERSDAYEEMLAALDFTDDEMDEYASRAARARIALAATGDAGELAEYLDYDFLFYH